MSKLKIIRRILLGACASLLLWSCTGKPAAPEFDLEKVTGGRLKSSDLKGKVVVVDFWATWCVPCKVEIPHYNKLVEKMKGKNFEFVGVTFDSETPKDVLPFLQDLKITYPITMGTDEVDSGFGGHFAYPTTFLLSKDWKIEQKYVGYKPNKIKDLEARIEKLLAAE
jgi:cytochrome c biogenesis protein CcmG, thiol:disulfide interchange protein DsbE